MNFQNLIDGYLDDFMSSGSFSDIKIKKSGYGFSFVNNEIKAYFNVDISHLYAFFDSEYFDGKIINRIFYQIPFSELNNNALFIEASKDFLNSNSHYQGPLINFPYYHYNALFQRINSILFISPLYKWELSKTKLYGRLIKDEIHNIGDFNNDFNVLLTEKPQGYPEILYKFEKTIYHNRLIYPKKLIFKDRTIGLVFFVITNIGLNDIKNYSQLFTFLDKISRIMSLKMFYNVVFPHLSYPFLRTYARKTLLELIAYMIFVTSPNRSKKFIIYSPRNDYLSLIYNRDGYTNKFSYNDKTNSEKIVLSLENKTHFSNANRFFEEWKNPIESWINLYIENIKAAIAAIMSRNMSHNLGSHILSYVKRKLNSTQTMITENVLRDLIVNGKIKNSYGYAFNLSKKLDKTDSVEDSVSYETREDADIRETPNVQFLLGLGKLINYLQERQDFIATVSSVSIPYFSTVNFKEFVFDEFTFDKKARRHNDNHEAYDNILLEYIAKSEGYKRERIEIKFRDFNGEMKEHPDLEIMRNIEIDLPGGIVGRQAFFSILENFVRNAAKHGGKGATNQKLEIILDVEDISDELYRVTLRDNNENCTDDILEVLRNALKEELIDSTGRLIETNKGIKEMKISAGWLRRIELHKIYDKNEPPVLELQKDASGKNIQYVFYLSKPQKVAIISENLVFRQAGWRAYSFDEFKQIKNISYRIVLIDESSNYSSHETNEIRKKASVRCFSYNCEELNEKLSSESKKESKNFYHYLNEQFDNLYTYWVGNFVAKKVDSLRIAIIDEKAFNHQKAKVNQKTVDNIMFLATENKEKLKRFHPHLIFRTHNDTFTEFENFRTKYTEIYNNAIFVEGISGGNSTDRLVRNEPINDLWVLKIVESAFTKVAIFDERIWSRLTGIEEFSLSEVEHLNLDHIIDQLNKFDSSTAYKEGKKIVEPFRNVLNKAGRDMLDDHLPRWIKEGNFEEMKALQNYIDSATQQKDLAIDETVFELFAKKNIQILNSIEAREGEFVIKDLKNNTVGKITKEKIELGEFDSTTFDFVVFHQGILDKWYDSFVESKLNSPSYQTEVNDYFNSIRNVIKASKRYIIHSGRSKPHNLPRDTAFIQYSSLENAFFDCKFTLTELLYTSVLEESTNA